MVLGCVARDEPEAVPSEPAVAVGALSTLGALVGSPRDGRRLAVNVGDNYSPAWVLVRWT